MRSTSLSLAERFRSSSFSSRETTARPSSTSSRVNASTLSLNIDIAWSYIGRIKSTSGKAGCRFSFLARRAIVVAIEQALHGPFQAALSQPSHHEHIVAQRAQRFVKCSQNMFCRDHCCFFASFLFSFCCSYSSSKSARDVILCLFFGGICENL